MVGVRSESVGVVIEVDQKASIWLAKGGVVNCCHEVEDNRHIQ